VKFGDTRVLFHKWIRSAKVSDQSEKNFALSLWLATTAATALSLSREVIQSCADLLERMFIKGMTKGKAMRVSCAASLYLACRKHNVAVTLDEVANAVKCDKRKIARCVRQIVEQLGLKYSALDLDHYCHRLLGDLKAAGKTVEFANDLLSIIKTSRITVGKDTRGVASAVAYLALRRNRVKISQRQISVLAGITEMTIRTRCREIEELVEP
jgi:transcription initiation factor TFIIB